MTTDTTTDPNFIRSEWLSRSFDDTSNLDGSFYEAMREYSDRVCALGNVLSELSDNTINGKTIRELGYLLLDMTAEAQRVRHFWFDAKQAARAGAKEAAEQATADV
jgi:hypothetical protein